MSDKDKSDQVARLERLNEELGQSLKRCRDMLHDYQAKLAANLNEPEDPDEDDETREA